MRSYAQLRGENQTNEQRERRTGPHFSHWPCHLYIGCPLGCTGIVNHGFCDVQGRDCPRSTGGKNGKAAAKTAQRRGSGLASFWRPLSSAWILSTGDQYPLSMPIAEKSCKRCSSRRCLSRPPLFIKHAWGLLESHETRRLRRRGLKGLEAFRACRFLSKVLVKPPSAASARRPQAVVHLCI